MKLSNRRHRAIAAHEAAHLCIAHWNGFPWREIKLKGVGVNTTGCGDIIIPPYPKNWETDATAMIDLKIHFYKVLMVFAAGYIAEAMYSSPVDFWKFNKDIMQQSEKTDLTALRECVAVLPRNDFEAILFQTHDTLSAPKWKIVMDVADELLKEGIIKKVPWSLDSDHIDSEILPEYSAEFLIKFLTDNLYKEKSRKAA